MERAKRVLEPICNKHTLNGYNSFLGSKVECQFFFRNLNDRKRLKVAQFSIDATTIEGFMNSKKGD